MMGRRNAKNSVAHFVVLALLSSALSPVLSSEEAHSVSCLFFI